MSDTNLDNGIIDLAEWIEYAEDANKKMNGHMFIDIDTVRYFLKDVITGYMTTPVTLFKGIPVAAKSRVVETFDDLLALKEELAAREDTFLFQLNWFPAIPRFSSIDPETFDVVVSDSPQFTKSHWKVRLGVIEETVMPDFVTDGANNDTTLPTKADWEKFVGFQPTQPGDLAPTFFYLRAVKNGGKLTMQILREACPKTSRILSARDVGAVVETLASKFKKKAVAGVTTLKDLQEMVAKDTHRGVANTQLNSAWYYIGPSAFDSPIIVIGNEEEDRYAVYAHPDFDKYGFNLA